MTKKAGFSIDGNGDLIFTSIAEALEPLLPNGITTVSGGYLEKEENIEEKLKEREYLDDDIDDNGLPVLLPMGVHIANDKPKEQKASKQFKDDLIDDLIALYPTGIKICHKQLKNNKI